VRAWVHSLVRIAGSSVHHFGRLAGYVLAGALSGLVGNTIQLVLDLARIGTALRIASGVLLAFLAVRVLISWNGMAWLDRMGAKFWSRLRPIAARAARNNGVVSRLTLGFLWGWLPCGLVYSMLLFAATSGAALNGALIMLAFGLGTMPSMLASSLFGMQLQRLMSFRGSRAATGVLLLAFSAWMIVAPLMTVSHATHVH
jgi:sulfite exporter TauE/SafE